MKKLHLFVYGFYTQASTEPKHMYVHVYQMFDSILF